MVLARLHGEPLGWVTLPLRDARIEPGDLAAGLWAATGERVREHAAANGCLPAGKLDSDAVLAGLSPAGRACPGASAPASPTPFASVIVPTAGRATALLKCLTAMRRLSYPSFEVLVVDNQPGEPSTRRVVEEVARQDERVRYLAEARPGSSVARNAGLAHSRADVVAFTDDDVEVEPDWLDWMVQPFGADAHVDAVTGLVLPSEIETPAQRLFESYGGFGKGLTRREFDLERSRADDEFLYPYWGGAFGSGNSMAFRRQALIGIGGFDPALGAGSPARAGADIDALSHVILRGGRLVYQPRAVCWHVHRREAAALRRQLFSYGVGLGAILTKWMTRQPLGLMPPLARAAARMLSGRFSRGAKRYRSRPELPPQLGRLELAGYVAGPVLYLQSVLWARRRRLADALSAARD